MRETVSISLTGDIKSALDEAAQEEGVSRGDLVRRALQDFLLVRGQPVLEIAKREIDRVSDDNFLGTVWNTWPGDETIEDLLDVLKSDQPKSE